MQIGTPQHPSAQGNAPGKSAKPEDFVPLTFRKVAAAKADARTNAPAAPSAAPTAKPAGTRPGALLNILV